MMSEGEAQRRRLKFSPLPFVLSLPSTDGQDLISDDLFARCRSSPRDDHDAQASHL